MKKFISKYGRNLLVAITLALVFVSFRDFFIQFSEKDKDVALFPSFLIASSIVLLYAIPIAFLIYYLVKKLNVSCKVVMLSFILGFTLPLYLGSLGNSLISMFLFFIKAPQTLLDEWGAALTAPFAEEIAKGIVVLLVYLLCKGISLKEAFISGMISGFGFQVFEDWAYIFQSTFGETNSGFTIAFERVSNALGSHMAFAIVFGVGLIALIKKSSVISRPKALCFIIAPVILHFIWNSPLEGDWVFLLIGSINLNLAYYVFTNVNNLDNNDKLARNVLVE
ncbi:PrsW family intramembrane metalloprotease [Anaerococcus porci]|uniref:PrsW family intramembrane metalloprotease n=1 Tax=Anaerococcus porci TaxID=2652269 RepID=A0A6N7VTR4_9FIRM|nr:PrsW family glutamic-type intramembrane protease [Anaerococcus porci]MDY3005960.1 PrsW family glutamic-type intramembrane protease [Anaerococcus porci]MSS77099.1 PrsW family intramembrane metalloprotease [Anaerococcus porci]